MGISREYIASLTVIIVSLLGLFGIDVGNEELTAIITGAAALYVIYRKIQKGEITPLGARKN